jgi:hypothetical protein
MTLSLRAWRYGSKASARHADDPVAALTIKALLEADVAGRPGNGNGSTGEQNNRAARDRGEASSQGHHQETSGREAALLGDGTARRKS